MLCILVYWPCVRGNKVPFDWKVRSGLWLADMLASQSCHFSRRTGRISILYTMLYRHRHTQFSLCPHLFRNGVWIACAFCSFSNFRTFATSHPTSRANSGVGEGLCRAFFGAPPVLGSEGPGCRRYHRLGMSLWGALFIFHQSDQIKGSIRTQKSRQPLTKIWFLATRH